MDVCARSKHQNIIFEMSSITPHQDGWKYDPIESYNHIHTKRYYTSC